MKSVTLLLVVATVGICGGLGGFTWNLFRQIRAVNEPDPAGVSLDRVRKSIGSLGVAVKIDRLLYVNRDYNGYVFLGRIDASKLDLRPATSSIPGLYPLQMDSAAFSHRFSGELGMVRTVRLPDGRTVVGIIPGAEPVEFFQAESRFRTKTDEMAARLVHPGQEP